MQVIVNDELGREVGVKCSPDDPIGDLKKLISAQTGTTHSKIQLKKGDVILEDRLTLQEYDINDGTSLDMSQNTTEARTNDRRKGYPKERHHSARSKTSAEKVQSKKRDHREGTSSSGGGGSGGAGKSQSTTMTMIEVIANDRLGRKVRVKCSPDDTVGDLKKLMAAQTGTNSKKIQLRRWYIQLKDHISLRDYEIHDGTSLDMY